MTKTRTNGDGTPFKLHVTNILDIKHCPITCLDLNKCNTQLALFRGGDASSIEIWSVSHVPFLQKILYDLETNDGKPSVEGLVWIHDRLFSCGLHGFIIEHDLTTRKIKGKYMATSGPVWQISANPDETMLAAGTEDGFVNIFQVVDDGLIFVKVLDRQEGRVLCLSWSPCGKYIATGSVDNVRLWDVEKGHAVQRLITGRSKNTETIVWSILLLDNLTIVSGDSRGIVSFWDGRIGVLKYKILTHKADILCLKMSADKSCIYASGVDPSVVLLVPVGKDGEKWVKSHQRNMHTNDVMCLAALGHKLISAGVDCDLTISSPPRRHIPKIVTKYPPLPKSSRIFSSRASRRVLIQDPRGLNIWQLPRENQEELVKLLEMKSRSGQMVHSSCFSPSGQLFGYSTAHRGMSFFRLATLADGSLAPVKLKKHFAHADSTSSTSEDFKLSHRDSIQMLWTLHFLTETLIFAISMDGAYSRLIQVNLDTDSVTFKPEVSLEDFIKPNGTDIVVSQEGGNHVAIATSTGKIHVLEISLTTSNESLAMVTNCCDVPKYKCPVSSLGFHSTLPFILITYADHSVQLFDFSTRKIVFHEQIGGSNQNHLHQHYYKVRKIDKKQKNEITETQKNEEKNDFHQEEEVQVFHPISGSSWSTDGASAVLYSLNKVHLMEISGEVGASNVDWKSLNIPEEYLAFVDFLDCDQLLTVQVKPSVVFNKLPPVFAKKRFGM